MPRKSEILDIVSADKKSASVVAIKEIPKTKSKMRHAGKKTTVSVRKKSEIAKPKQLTIHSSIIKRKRVSTDDFPLITKKKSSPIISSPTLSVQRNLSLALLSPFRFPIDHSHLVSQVARYAGTAFIMIGGFFTLYNINAVNSYLQAAEVSQVAQTTSSSDCASSINCPPTSPGTGTVPTVDSTPPADLNVESNVSTLSGTVPVNVTVPFASTVTLAARSSDSNQYFTLGTLTRISDLVWRNYWQTANFLDGSYRLRAVITNQYGTYTVEDQDVHTILNHPIEQEPTPTDDETTPETTTNTTPVSNTTETAPTTSSTTSLETTPTTVPTTEMRVDVGSDTTLSEIISVRTFVYGATSVRLFIRLRSASGASFAPMGYASLHGGNEWRFIWDTTIIPDGAYDLKVQAILQNGSSVVRTLITNIDNETPNTTPTATTTVATTSVPTPTTIQPLEPAVGIVIAKESPISGDVEIYINVPLASSVELYSIQTNTLTPRFLGLANKQNDSMWRYRLNSQQMPNGSYELFAKVRHVYGESMSSRIRFSVMNPLVTEKTDEEAAYVETLIRVSEETAPQPELLESAPLITPLEFGEEDTLVRDEIEDLLESFTVRVQDLITEYARAVRLDNTEARDAARARMDALEAEIITKLPQGDERAEMVQKVREYLSSMNTELREKTERNETFIKERIGDAVVKDTDKDGISDYDEVSIYRTDPLTADTDSDGYVDGAEILSGYNPTDDKPQANIQYESPKDTGVVRDDLLTVTTIGSLSSDTEQDSKSAVAMITGTGLPSSFVTLYIFSTPIVVTVKTDTQGNWSYIFDKELDDGEHEIYVGITDNAGKIVAKSNPLAFVKTAEAFSPVDAEASAVLNTQPQNPSLLSGDMMLVVGSIAVVALGLVLILLGLHVKPQEPELVQA